MSRIGTVMAMLFRIVTVRSRFLVSPPAVALAASPAVPSSQGTDFWVALKASAPIRLVRTGWHAVPLCIRRHSHDGHGK